MRLFGGQILPPAMFRRCCRLRCLAGPRYFWRRSESASAASTRRRRGARAQDAPSASYCWSWASIAAPRRISAACYGAPADTYVVRSRRAPPTDQNGRTRYE